VDGRGVPLPLAAAEPGLPVLTNAVGPPAGPTGAPWGDPAVEAAARAAAALRPYRERLKVDRLAVEAGDGGLDTRGRGGARGAGRTRGPGWPACWRPRTRRPPGRGHALRDDRGDVGGLGPHRGRLSRSRTSSGRYFTGSVPWSSTASW